MDTPGYKPRYLLRVSAPGVLLVSLRDGIPDHLNIAALSTADLLHVRTHYLRHTAGTYLLSQGVHPKVEQELLGHSSITLTMNTYSHVLPVLHKEVAGHMDRLLDARQSAS
jgi:integrase